MSGTKYKGLKLNQHLRAFYESTVQRFMESIGGLIHCTPSSTGQAPRAFWKPLMKFNLGSSFLGLCQPSALTEVHLQHMSQFHSFTYVWKKQRKDKNWNRL